MIHLENKHTYFMQKKVAVKVMDIKFLYHTIEDLRDNIWDILDLLT